MQKLVRNPLLVILLGIISFLPIIIIIFQSEHGLQDLHVLIMPALISLVLIIGGLLRLFY